MLKTVLKKITILLIMSVLLQLFAGVAPVIAEEPGGMEAEPEFAPLLEAALYPGETTGATSVTVTGYVYGNLLVNVTEQEIAIPQVGDIAPIDGENLIADYESGAEIAAGVEAGNYLQIYDADMEDEARIFAFYQEELTEDDIKEEGVAEEDTEEEPAEGLMMLDFAPMSGEPFAGAINSDGAYELPADFSGAITIGNEATLVTIVGSGAENQQIDTYIIVAERSSALSLTIEDLNIQAPDDKPGIDFAGDSDHELNISGSSKVSGGNNCAGIHVPEGVSLTITSVSDGSLEATGGQYGAGIGSGHYGTGGTITISDGTVTATGGSGGGAGIGAGYSGHRGKITISGGDVTAIGNSHGAGIGGYESAGDTIEISGGTVKATGGSQGAGIGGGWHNNGGTITISGGDVTAKGLSGGGAGIGGGYYAVGGTITIINNPTVIATGTGTNRGADIGNGYGKSGVTTIKRDNGDGPNLTYIRLEVKDLSPTGNKITFNGQEHEINSDGLTGLFVDKSAEVSTNITLITEEHEDTEISIKPGSVQNKRITLNENVTILYNAGTGGTVSKTSETPKSVWGVAEGSEATADAGYSFVNWIKGGEVVGTETIFIPAKTNGIYVAANYTANFNANTYTVIFNANGGGAPSTANKEVTYDSTYGELPTVTREHYKFKGWFTAPSGGVEITAANEVKITSDQTLYAQWEEKPEITVTANDATKIYDGTELTNNGWSLTSGTLAAGDELIVTVYGSRTAAGASDNEITEVKVMHGITDVTENYDITEVNGTLTVTARPLEITAVSAAKTYDGTTLTDEGYEITDGSLADGQTLASVTVTGSQLYPGSSANTANGAVITDGAEDITGNYDIAYVEGTLTVTAAEIEITVKANDATKIYDGTELTNNGWSLTSGTLAAGDELIVTVYGSRTAAGASDNEITEVKVMHGITDVTENYDITEVNGTLTVTARPLEITAASAAKTYDGTTLTDEGYEITDGSLSDGQTLASVTVTGSQLYLGSSANTANGAVIRDAGSNDVTGNYDIAYVEGTLTVTAAEIEITVKANDATKVYDGTELTNNGWSLTSGVLAAGDELIVTVAGSRTGVGASDNEITEVKVMHGITDVTENYEITEVNGTLTVTARPLEITAASAAKTYDGTPLTDEGYEITDGSLADGQTLASVTVTGSQLYPESSANTANGAVIRDAGSNDVTGNYDIAYVEGTLTVTAAEIEITVKANDATKVYDGTELTNNGWSLTSGTLAAGDELIVTVYGSRTAAGASDNEITEVKVMHDGTTDVTENYDITEVNGTLTVTARPLEITAASAAETYDGTTLTDEGYEITDGSLADGQTLASVTVTGSQLYPGSSANTANGAVIRDAGSNDITGNYDIAYVEGTLTVTAAEIEITVTANDATKIYDGTELTNNGWSLTSGVLAAGDELIVTVAGSRTDVGASDNEITEVKVMHDGTTDVTENYDITEVNGTLTVTARPLEITAASAAKTYDGTQLTDDGYEITDGSLADGQTLASVTVTGSQTDPGSSANAASEAVIRDAGSNDVTGNYAIMYVEGMLVVNRRSSGGGGSGNNTAPSQPTPSQPTQGNVIVIVNGEEHDAGIETKTTEGEKSTVTIEVDNQVVESKINEAVISNPTGAGNAIQVPVADTESEAAKVELTGDIVKKLEENTFDVLIKRDNVEYIIPAEEFTISQVAENLGIAESDLKDIKVEVKIARLDESVITKYNEAVKVSGAELVFPPVEFVIVAKTIKSDNTTREVEISKFSSYVERVMQIPSGVDPDKITTGVVFNPDGTCNHVPTVIYQQDGKWYARLNSLTNSAYSVVWNPITVKSVENHWAKDTVNDMASRLVIFNPETFEPNKAITRADFAEYIVRALGLYREGSKHENEFTDVQGTGARTKAILIATEYGIVSGYPDGTFRPGQQITREEAMVIYQRAMKITNLSGSDQYRYQSFTDFAQVSSWAEAAVKEALSAHIFNGTSETTISPKSNMTNAEAAQAIKNLLAGSKLINQQP